jgi:DNA-binding LacI/PurR family transcriptional regulator
MDGVLFAGSIWSADRDDLNSALDKLGRYMPVATICPPDVALECICIQSDLVNCSRLPVRHLHTLGHRRIAFIGGSMHSKDASRRGAAFLEQLRSLGLADDPAYHVDAGYDMEGGERAVLRMLSALPRERWPSAIVAFNDLVALGAVRQLKKMGLRLPEEMAIVGCDNQFFCPYADPPLTSVDLHPAEMAQSAVRELLVARESASRSFITATMALTSAPL